MKNLRRKKMTLAGTMVATLALTCGVLVGCGVAGGPQGTAPKQPFTHTGRYESIGTDGCYNCHGATDTSTHQNESAPAIPENHYVDGSSSTQQLISNVKECIVCHTESK